MLRSVVFFLLALLFFSLIGNSQDLILVKSSINSGGGSVIGENIIVDHTIGQSTNISLVKKKDALFHQGYQPVMTIIDQIITGTSDPSFIKASLFPNPTSGQVTLELGDITHQGRVKIRLIDFRGAQIQSTQETIRPLEFFDFTHLPKGTYLLTLGTNQSTQQLKLLIR